MADPGTLGTLGGLAQRHRPYGTSEEYASALAYLNSFIDYERQPDFVQTARFDLARMEAILAGMGDPHRRVPTVHIAGSKGKGSTATMVAAILQAAGQVVGLYTQPHLRDFRERIRVNGEKITPAEVVALVETRLRPAIEAYQRDPAYGELTFFEVYTALAFAHFAERATVQVIEVGLGGRLDATNVVQPEVSVITPISLEHTAVLGNTLAAIAREKAGIIKPGVPVVSGPQMEEVAAVLREVCEQRGCALIWADERFTLPPRTARFTTTGSYFTLETHECREERHGVRSLPRHSSLVTRHSSPVTYPDLFLPLVGPHQVENAATAVAVVETLQEQGWPIPLEAVRTGLANARRPGCVQVVRERPWLILDGAHNRASAERLAETLQALFLFPGEGRGGKGRKGREEKGNWETGKPGNWETRKLGNQSQPSEPNFLISQFPSATLGTSEGELGGARLIVVWGSFRDKDVAGVAAALAPHAAEIILTTTGHVRALSSEELRAAIGPVDVPLDLQPDLATALSTAQSRARADDVICVTGSLQLVGEALRILGVDVP
jgi:dihydrofolate synthase/folylpolyglutamate synthase